MSTKAFRIGVSLNIAAATIQTFLNPKNRGSEWIPDSMDGLIKDAICKQRVMHNVEQKYENEMVEFGVKFYRQHFKEYVKSTYVPKIKRNILVCKACEREVNHVSAGIMHCELHGKLDVTQVHFTTRQD